MFTTFARSVTRLNRWIGKFTAWIVVPLFLLLLCDVVMRYAAGRPLPWTAELAQLVFGIYGILAGGFLLAERGHVNVDILYGRFSPKKKARAVGFEGRGSACACACAPASAWRVGAWRIA